MRIYPLAARLLLLLALSCASTTRAQEGSPPDPWQPVARLVGEWHGTATGEAGSGTVVRRYAKVLSGRFIQESNTTTYPPQEKNRSGEVHEHMSMISHDRERRTLVLRQFHVEGFVNTYRQVSPPGADALVFESEKFENFSNRWRARETYEFSGDDRLVEVFELAPPGKPFQVYGRSELRRVR